MKNKIILCLVVLVCGACLTPLAVYAYLSFIPVHPKDIPSTLPFVRFSVGKPEFVNSNNCVVNYTIYVLPKENEIFGGDLKVKDNSGKIIAQIDMPPTKNLEYVDTKVVPKSWAGKCVEFQFRIGTNYLSESEFNLNQTYAGQIGFGVVYEFKMKEFSSAN